jgi:hypothetical protein
MPFPLLLPAIAGIGSLIGGALKNKSTQTTTNQLDPGYSGLQTMILQSLMKRLSAPTGLPEGYEASGIGAINSTYDLVRQARENALTSRGLAGSPVAANADLVAGNSRAGQIGQFRAGLPLVSRDLQNQDLAMAANILPMGRTSSTTTGTSGGGAAGAATNLAQMIGFLIGSGKLKTGGGIPGMGGSSWMDPDAFTG